MPRRTGVVELADLGSDAFPLTAEIGVVSLALKELDTLRQDQYRGDRQCGAAAARSYRRAPENRSALAEAGVRRDALPRAKEAAFERFVDKVRKKLGAAQMR